MKPREPLGWVLYDDACGSCRWLITFWSAALCKRGFKIAPLQDPWVKQRLGLPPEELVRDLRLLLAGGRQVIGADVYRYVMRRIGWAWPLYACSIAPVLRKVFDASYRTFADNRYRVSRTCRLPANSGRERCQEMRGVSQSCVGLPFNSTVELPDVDARFLPGVVSYGGPKRNGIADLTVLRPPPTKEFPNEVAAIDGRLAFLLCRSWAAPGFRSC